MWNINAPHGRIPCAIFTKFAEFVPNWKSFKWVKVVKTIATLLFLIRLYQQILSNIILNLQVS